MPTTDETIATLFADATEMEPANLEVAIVLARSMVIELKAALRSWEAQARQLDELKRSRSPALN